MLQLSIIMFTDTFMGDLTCLRTKVLEMYVNALFCKNRGELKRYETCGMKLHKFHI